MRLFFTPLSDVDVKFMLQIANADKDTRNDIAIASELDRHFCRMQKQLSRRKLTGQTATDDKKTRKVVTDWVTARRSLVWVLDGRNLKEEGFFCRIPPVGLPSKTTTLMLGSPIDAVDWLIACAVANSQHRHFVKCARCDRWGFRKRGGQKIKYCSAQCQAEENREQVKNATPEPKSFTAPSKKKR